MLRISPNRTALLKKDMMKARPKKRALVQTTEEYASRTTIHGIGYISDGRLVPIDRLLWTLLVLAFLALATALTWNSWTQWQEQQVKRNWTLYDCVKLKCSSFYCGKQ